MKIFISILSVLIIQVPTAFNQDIDTSNIYLQALGYHIGAFNTDTQSTSGESVYFVEIDKYTTKDFPPKIGTCKIELVDKGMIKSMTSNNKELDILVVRPARWKDGSLIITVIDFSVTRKRNHFFYTNKGGSSFQVVPGRGYELKLELKTRNNN